MINILVINILVSTIAHSTCSVVPRQITAAIAIYGTSNCFFVKVDHLFCKMVQNINFLFDWNFSFDWLPMGVKLDIKHITGFLWINFVDHRDCGYYHERIEDWHLPYITVLFWSTGFCKTTNFENISDWNITAVT